MSPYRYEPADWYDFPSWFDVVHREDTPRESTFLRQVHRRHVESRGRSVLEPACGSGRLLLALARRGFSVSGFDNNRTMLEAARKRLRAFGRKAHLFDATLDDFHTRRRFDLAFCLISTFRYLPSESAARRHLRLVRDSLRPGGVYVLGLHLCDYRARGTGRERWVGTRGATRVVCNLLSRPPDRRRRREPHRLRMIVERNGTVRRIQTHFELRTYDAWQLQNLLQAVGGLRLESVYDFSCRIDRPVALDDDRLDKLLVLKRS